MLSSHAMDLSAEQVCEIEQSGRSPAAVRRQLVTLRARPERPVVIRPAILEDGITPLAADAQVPAAWQAVRHRLTSFVPASGAASRLFASLRRLVADPEHPDRDAQKILDRRTDLAVWPAPCGDRAAELGTVMAWAGQPKGLVPWHRDGEAVRTAFEEHLWEAAALGGEATRVHFTVSADHLERFEATLALVAEQVMAATATQLDVEFSTQHPCTDTVALAPDGSPFLDEDGRLLFRPGGHGALIRNLASLGADLVLIKNIDNVVAHTHRDVVVRWRRSLVAALAELEEERNAVGEALDRGHQGSCLVWLEERFGLVCPPGQDRTRFAHDRLRRPLRAAAMVRSLGHPGGGPFWVQDADGQVTRQILEGVQLDPTHPAHARALAGATHFNPVDIAASLRDRHGAVIGLEALVDERATLRAHKQHQGRPLLALEHPGLWNGAMAGWNTVFFEVPDTTFHPVKSLSDLLCLAHGALESHAF
jgi:hypothetical protein